MAKVLIEVSDETWGLASCIQHGSIGEDIVLNAFKNGKAIPSNATNGDVIKIMFPKAEVIEKRAVVMVGISRMIVFDLDWWNAPYNS